MPNGPQKRFVDSEAATAGEDSPPIGRVYQSIETRPSLKRHRAARSRTRHCPTDNDTG